MILTRAFVTLAVLSFAGQALAQQAEGTADPITLNGVTENLLLQELTAHRNWQATAIAKDQAWERSKKQLVDAQAQVGDLQKQLDTLKETTKAAPTPPAK